MVRKLERLAKRPKGGRPFLLPLSVQLVDLLKSKQACLDTATMFPKSSWVFPARVKLPVA